MMATLLIYEGKLALKCTYDEKDKAKQVPGCKWNSEMKVWQYQVDRRTVEMLRDTFPGLKIAGEVRRYIERVEQRRIELIELKNQTDADINVTFADKLRNYQRVGANFLCTTKRAILADDMGTGKTLQTITACENSDLKRVLVVCPNTLKWTWFDEVDKWTGSTAVVVDGNKKKRDKAISEFDGKYLIVNYESLRLHEELSKMKWDALIFDEAHKLKNRKAQQTKAAKKLKSDNVYLLSGTPLLNRPDELWSLLNRLHPEKFSSYWRFVEQYCEVVHNGFANEIKGCKPEQEKALRELLAPVMLRRTKKEVLTELPDKVHQRYLVELTPKQRKIYDKMENEAMVMLTGGEVVAAPVVIAQITRLRQIAISPQLISQEIDESAKFDALMDIIMNNKEGHKIAVFSQFRRAVELFSKKLDEKGIKWVAVTGSVSQEDRREATRQFQEEDGTRVMLATIEAASLGLTWTSADIAVFIDRHWTPAINTQAEDRLHRMGQKNSVQIINLVARDTIEERIEKMLESKAATFESIINQQVTADMMRKLFEVKPSF